MVMLRDFTFYIFHTRIADFYPVSVEDLVQLARFREMFINQLKKVFNMVNIFHF